MSLATQVALWFALGNLVAAVLFLYWRPLVHAIGGALLWCFVAAALAGAGWYGYRTLGKATFLHFATAIVTFIAICLAIGFLRAVVTLLRRKLKLPRFVAQLIAWLVTFAFWECGAVLIWALLERHNKVPFDYAWQAGVAIYLFGSLYGWIGRWDPASRRRPVAMFERAIAPDDFRGPRSKAS